MIVYESDTLGNYYGWLQILLENDQFYLHIEDEIENNNRVPISKGLAIKLEQEIKEYEDNKPLHE